MQEGQKATASEAKAIALAHKAKERAAAKAAALVEKANSALESAKEKAAQMLAGHSVMIMVRITC